jgi:hypothetical protein
MSILPAQPGLATGERPEPEYRELANVTRYRAQGERADNGVNAGRRQSNLFAGQIKKFHIQRSSPLAIGAFPHSRIGLESEELADFCCIVVRKIHPRAYPDFQNHSVRLRNQQRTNLLYRLRVAKDGNDMGIDAVPIERHAWLK